MPGGESSGVRSSGNDASDATSADDEGCGKAVFARAVVDVPGIGDHICQEHADNYATRSRLGCGDCFYFWGCIGGGEDEGAMGFWEGCHCEACRGFTDRDGLN